MSKPSPEEALTGRRNRRKNRKPSNAQRRAKAPREPRGPMLRYTQGIAQIMGRVQALVEAELFPLLPEAVGEGQGHSEGTSPTAVGSTVEEVAPLSATGVGATAWHAPALSSAGVSSTVAGTFSRLSRTDTRGCLHCGPLPDWYGRAVVFRHDTLSDRFASRFGFLEVAITELLREPTVIQLLTEVAGSLERHNRREMERVLFLNLRSNARLQGFVESFVQRNVSLIQSVSFDQLSRMEGIISASTAGQTRVEALAAQLRGTFDVSKARANLIARDQTLKANANLTQLRQQSVGVTEYIWTTSRDERVRGAPEAPTSASNHFALDGTRQSWLVPPVTNPVTGERNHPGEDYQCRCTANPIVDHLLG